MTTVNQKVEKWLDNQWVEKEKQMTYFANNQRFDDEWSEYRVWIDDPVLSVESGDV